MNNAMFTAKLANGANRDGPAKPMGCVKSVVRRIASNGLLPCLSFS